MANQSIIPGLMSKVCLATFMVYLMLYSDGSQGKRELGAAQDERTLAADGEEAILVDEDEFEKNVEELKESDEADDEAEEGDEAEEENEDYSEPGEAQDAFNEPKDASFNEVKGHSFVNQTTTGGWIKLKVATWNMLAIAKSKNTPTGMIAFNEYAKSGFANAKLEHVKMWLDKLMTEGFPSGYDLIGLQEVDGLTPEKTANGTTVIEELKAFIEGKKYGILQGPAYKSRDGLIDYSYLLYKKLTFKDTSACENDTPTKAEYMKCKMVLMDNSEFRIVTGHSASSGLQPPTYTDKKGKPQTDEHTAAIADFDPKLFFGDFNTDSAKVQKAFKSKFAAIYPPAGSKSVLPTSRKTVYQYRKLMQGIENTNNWKTMQVSCHTYLFCKYADGSDVGEEVPCRAKSYAKFGTIEKELKAKTKKLEAAKEADPESEHQGLKDEVEALTNRLLPFQSFQNEVKYGDRWCDPSKNDKSWAELQLVFKGKWGENEDKEAKWYTKSLNTIKDDVGCTDPPECATVSQKMWNFVEVDEVQEDGIAISAGTIKEGKMIAKIPKIGIQENPGARERFPDSFPENRYPNAAFMSDHFIVTAEVKIDI